LAAVDRDHIARGDDMDKPAPIAGLTGVEHIGLTVPSLEEAMRFFSDVIGAEVLYDIGPFESADDWMASHLAEHPRARINKVRMIRVANGPVLELFEFTSPDQRTTMPRNSDFGGWHIAFYVEDMDRALAALKAHQCRIQNGPVTMTEGPSAGLTWLYFQAPWGQQLEVVSYPGGIAAYRALGREVWRPR
jgi:catechol 2,3-dioxygenase-like lactoylglutathione lyase family enzyme